MKPERLMLTTNKAADLLGISRKALNLLIARGVLTVSPLRKRNRLVPYSQLESLVKEAEMNKKKQRNIR